MERVPHMASFIFVSIFPQIPLLIYLTILGAPITAFEQIGGAILLAFLFLSLYFAWYALQVIIREQTARFLLDGLDTLDENQKDGNEEEKGLLSRGKSQRSSSVAIDPVGILKNDQNKLFQRTGSVVEMSNRKSNQL